jgi:hypothetical protein
MWELMYLLTVFLLQNMRKKFDPQRTNFFRNPDPHLALFADESELLSEEQNNFTPWQEAFISTSSV